MDEKRILLFDNLKGFLIFLVVIGHVIDLAAYPSNLTRFIYFWIFYFHMPLFIFIMGYFSKNTIKCRQQVFEQFFFPYLALIALTFIQVRFLLPMGENTVLRVLTPKGSSWFLLAMLIWKFLLHDLIKIRHVLVFSLALGLLSGFSHEFGNVLALGRICTFTFFYLAGYYTKQEHIIRIRKIPKILVFVVGLLVSGVIYYLACIREIPVNNILLRYHYNDNDQIQDFLYRGIYYIIACIMIVICINLISNKKSILTTIGQRTLVIYLLHMFIVRWIEAYCGDIMILKQNALLYLLVVIVFSIIIVGVLSTKWVQNLYKQFFDWINSVFFRSVE